MYQYPNFTPSFGNLTKNIRDDYINTQVNRGLLPPDANKQEKITSLIASNNLNDKLFFWQLYSMIGEKIVIDIVTHFYQKIFNDNENTWFKSEFVKLGDIDYHVRGQKNFWLDVMGGGTRYYGDTSRLNRKHNNVKTIMTYQGAQLWMNYMKDTLIEIKFPSIIDKRVIPCINSFLNYFMYKYSVEFDFNVYYLLDNSDTTRSVL
jgi:truncated hemoglobin YjbI